MFKSNNRNHKVVVAYGQMSQLGSADFGCGFLPAEPGVMHLHWM